jgi:hypothetical protein
MTEPRRNPPSQKAFPLEEWSKADRETWKAARAAAGCWMTVARRAI